MPVDSELQPILDLIAAAGSEPPMEAGPVQFREMFDTMCAAFGPGPQDIEVSDLVLDGRDHQIPARCYRPAGCAGGTMAPTLVFLHGGGFVIGSLDTHDALCRSLSAEAGVVVVAVDYRLAPEHPAPAAVHDAVDALAAVIAAADGIGIDRDRLAIGGDSAGGNLAAVAAIHHQQARILDPTQPELRLQLLIYPVVDLSEDADRFPSLHENGQGYFLTLEAMEFFGHHYLTGSQLDAASPEVSPIRTADLTGGAPAFVLTAEYDPLRDEGEAYAARLAAAGIPVTSVRLDGAIHGFIQMGAVASIGRRGVDAVAGALRAALGDRG